MSTDLTITSDQTEFTPTQLAALRQIGVEDASPADLAVFLHQAQRTGLDPFTRQMYMIGRWDSRNGRVKQQIQTSIDGFRVVASRRAAEMGVPLSISAALLADPRTGQWNEVLPDGVIPLAAKVTVKLGDGVFEAVAPFAEYRQTTKDGRPVGLWGRMPATMLGKCAEAQALRKACPMDLSGLYTAEEMAQAETADEHRAPANIIAAESPSAITADQKANIADLAHQIGVTDEQLAYAVGWASMPQGRVATVEDMTKAEADKLIDFMLSKAHEGQEQAVLDVEVVTDEEVGE